ncbi:winged helix-turn-helix transcriptional regulator [Candidatus Pacearchaeota archaeon]|nr:winged helix-turn-helix transcriptional regulator [Candidatus Pacearchaeota archaeon]
MKNKSHILLFILIMFLYLQTASAQQSSSQQDSINLQIYIDNSGDITFAGTSTKDPAISGIIFKDNLVYGSTSLLTGKQGGLWQFSLTSEEFDEINAEIFLPDNSDILLESIKTNLSAGLSEEKGTIVLSLTGTGKLEIDFTYALEKEQKNNMWLVVLISILILIVLSIIYLLIRRKKLIRKQQIRKKRKPDKLKIASKMLNERENLILNTLLKEKGRSTQGVLQKLTGIPKAAFSRHLASLEKKGLIKKQGVGRLNRVELVK